MSFFGRRPKRSPTPTGSLSGQNSLTEGDSNAKPLYLCSPFADAALVNGNFRTVVALPKYVDVMEWVAVNIYDFYTNLNEFYGCITECCTQHTCPTMSAGPKYVNLYYVNHDHGHDYSNSSSFQSLSYLWTTPERKQVSLAAPTYIDSVMSSVQNLIQDENVFPTKSGQDFHKESFPVTVKHVYRQFLRIFAHIYHAHFHQILHLRAEPHFNSLFAHFLAFGREYQLLEEKDIKGDPNTPVGVGLLWERWKSSGKLEKSPGDA